MPTTGGAAPLFPPLLCRKELESPVLVRADPHGGRRSLTGAGNSGLGDSACITRPFGRKLRVRIERIGFASAGAKRKAA
jgi:hypothetical protein